MHAEADWKVFWTGRCSASRDTERIAAKVGRLLNDCTGFRKTFDTLIQAIVQPSSTAENGRGMEFATTKYSGTAFGIGSKGASAGRVAR